MKKLAAIFALSTFLALGATAKAADLVEAPMVYDWTGFYIGGNIGYAFGGKDTVELRSTTETSFDDLGDLKVQGIFGGGQIGYDWQVSSFVLGATADVEASNIHDSLKKEIVFEGLDEGNVHASDDINVWGTVRGRLGWAFDRVLIYGTGGLAWGDVDYKMHAINILSGEQASLEQHDVRFGYAVGAGLAWAIDENWSIGAEYLYVNLGKYNVKAHVIDGEGNRTAEVVTTEAEPNFHSIKGFVNFRF